MIPPQESAMSTSDTEFIPLAALAFRPLHPGMGQAVAERTIFRTLSDGTRENWGDVARRVALGNVGLLLPTSENAGHLKYDVLGLEQHIAQGRVLMSGRHLQHGDEYQFTRPGEVITNCSSAASSALLFYLLLNGSGVGRAYHDSMMVVDWRNMPEVVPILDEQHPDYAQAWYGDQRFMTREQAEATYRDVKPVVYFRVPDSREGWAKALERLETLTYMGTFKDYAYIIDFSDVRAFGAPIAGMQNRPASGPVPLMQAFLDAAAVATMDIEPWEQAMRIDHAFAACVAVGGARRAARLAVKDYRDPGIFKFINIKEHGGLWSSNNSVGVDAAFWSATDADAIPPTHARRVFDEVIHAQYNHASGEPGFINLDQLDFDPAGLEQYADGEFAGSNRYQLDPQSRPLMQALATAALALQYPMIVNPCFPGDQRIATSTGLQTFRDLHEESIRFDATVDERALFAHEGIVLDTRGTQAFASTPVALTRRHADVYQLTTREGYTLRATRDHKVLTPEGYRELGSLVPGDEVLLQGAEGQWPTEQTLPVWEAAYAHAGWAARAEREGRNASVPTTWSAELGVVLGLLAGDGFVSDNTVGFSLGTVAKAPAVALVQHAMHTWFGGDVSGSEHAGRTSLHYSRVPAQFFAGLGAGNAVVPAVLWSAPREAVIGYLRGLFAADGTVATSTTSGTASIRLTSVKSAFLQDVQQLLLNLGIKAPLYPRATAQERSMPDGRGGQALYACQPTYELIISAESRDRFAEVVGFLLPHHRDKLVAWQAIHCANHKRTQKFVARVLNVVHVGKEDVYCVTVPGPHSIIVSGIVTAQCSEIPLHTLGAYCTIGDVVPYHCDDREQILDAFRSTTRALIRANTMDTLYRKEVLRTNRIGVSFTGIHEFAWKEFGLGFNDLVNDFDVLVGHNPEQSKAYEFWQFMQECRLVCEVEADMYSLYLGVNPPHTVTTTKPAGTTSKVYGLTEGAHLPAMRRYLRWVQFQKEDPLVDQYEAKGYPVQRSIEQYPRVSLVGFPTEPTITTLGIPDDRFVTATEATPEQQFHWVQLLEHYWLGPRGNQISYTLKYNPSELDLHEYAELIRTHQRNVRCIAVMPASDWRATQAKYGYVPEEPVTDAEFAALMANIHGALVVEDIDMDTLQCSSGACPL